MIRKRSRLGSESNRGAGIPQRTDEEMKAIMKCAVDHVYQLLVLRDESPEEYESKIRSGERYTANWDEPRMPRATAPNVLANERL